MRLAEMYLYGNGVCVSLSNAAGWNCCAAKSNIAEGQWRLGVMCELGLGIKVDSEKETVDTAECRMMDIAVQNYKAASAQGHALAALRLHLLAEEQLFNVGPEYLIDLKEWATRSIPEACYYHGMRMIAAFKNGNLNVGRVEEAERDFSIASNAGIVEAYYGLCLCDAMHRGNVNAPVEEKLFEAMNKGSYEAALCWSRLLIDTERGTEAVEKLWDLYANGYWVATELLKKVLSPRYVDARSHRLATGHDKSKMPILLRKFLTVKNDCVVSDVIQDGSRTYTNRGEEDKFDVLGMWPYVDAGIGPYVKTQVAQEDGYRDSDDSPYYEEAYDPSYPDELYGGVYLNADGD